MANIYGQLKDENENNLYLNIPRALRINGTKDIPTNTTITTTQTITVPAGTYLFLFFCDWNTGGSDYRNLSFCFSDGVAIRTVRTNGTNGGGSAGWVIYRSTTETSYRLSFLHSQGSTITARYDCIAIRLYD